MKEVEKDPDPFLPGAPFLCQKSSNFTRWRAQPATWLPLHPTTTKATEPMAVEDVVASKQCYICLGAEGSVERHCACPSLFCHKQCLARWQLQSSGKEEEVGARGDGGAGLLCQVRTDGASRARACAPSRAHAALRVQGSGIS